ncbi:MAG: 23S rRNA (guanosine(2251)-2'-O)-methyltransferase RlmB, partial [Burkholderiaceae bacterium]|nr:23S rRNA (guanosine(2251)-2'-O)-methyltransferase RlmB [Burkholderiaceae bacterium]
MTDTRLIHGFHAITAKLRHAADDVKEITVAEGRQDGRMRDLLKLAEAHGVRIITSDAKRLDGLAGGTQHQGVVARVAAQARHVTLDDVLENLAEPALLLVRDGITDPH